MLILFDGNAMEGLYIYIKKKKKKKVKRNELGGKNRKGREKSRKEVI